MNVYKVYKKAGVTKRLRTLRREDAVDYCSEHMIDAGGAEIAHYKDLMQDNPWSCDNETDFTEKDAYKLFNEMFTEVPLGNEWYVNAGGETEWVKTKKHAIERVVDRFNEHNFSHRFNYVFIEY